MRIQTKNRTLLIGKKTLLMGILNITPDSFSDGGLYFDNPKKAVDQIKRMQIQGADIIDIGGESVRIGAEKVSLAEELRRVIPVISLIRKTLGDTVIISVDTYKSAVAQKAVEEGADIINDATGLQMDKKMPEIIGETGVAVVVTHMRHRLGMKQKSYSNVIEDTKQFFQEKIALLKKYGVAKEQIILDPGFGFCKTDEQNLELIKRLDAFTIFRLPILMAVSRKAVLGKILQEEFQSFMEYAAHERLSGSLAATAMSVLRGASIIRTHDVYETKNFLTVLDTLREKS